MYKSIVERCKKIFFSLLARKTRSESGSSSAEEKCSGEEGEAEDDHVADEEERREMEAAGTAMGIRKSEASGKGGSAR